jgi:hypothetical protein
LTDGSTDSSIDGAIKSDASATQPAQNFGESTGSGACSVGNAPRPSSGFSGIVLALAALTQLIRRSSRAGKKA